MIFNVADATILSRNFGGTKFDPRGGKRSFCMLIKDPNMVDELAAQGIEIKYTKVRKEGDEAKPYVVVNVNFNSKVPPVIQVIADGNITKMEEEFVAELDFVEIQKADVVINTGHWVYNGKEGDSVYLKALYLTVVRDAFASEYDQYR